MKSRWQALKNFSKYNQSFKRFIRQKCRFNSLIIELLISIQCSSYTDNDHNNNYFNIKPLPRMFILKRPNTEPVCVRIENYTHLHHQAGQGLYFHYLNVHIVLPMVTSYGYYICSFIFSRKTGNGRSALTFIF